MTTAIETQSGSAQNPAEQIKIFSKQKAQKQTKTKQSLSSSLVYAGDSDRESGGAAGESQTAWT